MSKNHNNEKHTCTLCTHSGHDVHEYPLGEGYEIPHTYQCDDITECLLRKYENESVTLSLVESIK